MIKKTFSIKNFQNWHSTGYTWSCLKPATDESGTIYYNQTKDNIIITEDGFYLLMENGNYSLLEISNEIIGFFSFFIGRKIDDMGVYNVSNEEWMPNIFYNSGNTITRNDISYTANSAHTSTSIFDESLWTKNVVSDINELITLTGDSKISLFRRYGKTDNDTDLYNPSWNSGYTMETINSLGLVQKITNSRENTDGIQKSYTYEIYPPNRVDLNIKYIDTDNGKSIIQFNTSGMTFENSINGANIKNENLFGVIDFPKTYADIFIDRGFNSCFDKHLKLNGIKTMNDLESYGNGEFIIK